MGFVVDFVHPVLLSIGSIDIYAYGFFLALAFIVTHKMTEMEFKRLNIDIEASNILMCAVVGGILGGKIHYVLTWDFDGIYDFNTGLSFQGGLLGGIFASMFYIKFIAKKEIGYAAEAVAPLMPLGHAIGKLGCFFSGDGCYGSRTNVWWGMSFPHGLNPVHHFVHPAPLYEFIVSGSLFLYFWITRNPQRNLPFDKFTSVLIALALSRIVIEPWRDHPPAARGQWGQASQYQIFALISAFVFWLIRMILAKTWWAAAIGGKSSVKGSTTKTTGRSVSPSSKKKTN